MDFWWNDVKYGNGSIRGQSASLFHDEAHWITLVQKAELERKLEFI